MTNVKVVIAKQKTITKGQGISMNILQQVIEQFINDLYGISLLEEGLSQSLETLQARANRFCVDIIRSEIEALDQTLAESPSLRPGWQVHKKVSRTQETLVGTLDYTRRYYVNKHTNERAYLLDILIGVEKHERIDRGLKAALCNQSVRHSYQMSTSLCCENRLSKQSVMRVLREVTVPQVEAKAYRRDAKIIHIQADEDHVSMQDHRRAKEVKLAVIHEPSYRMGKKGYLPQKHHQFSYKETTEDFWQRVTTSIDDRYALGDGLKVYLHGDGASWIQTGLSWLENSVFVLDKFHAWKALKQLAPVDSLEYLELRDSLLDADKKEFKRLVKICAEKYTKDSERVEQVTSYILNNWKGIEIWSQDPLSGGTCAEGLVSHCLSERLSMRPMAWLDEGLEQMTQLREHHFNGGKIRWCDFNNEKKHDKKMDEIKKSVKLEEHKSADDLRNAVDLLPPRQFDFPKRDARYRLFKRISEGGEAI